MSLEDSAKGLYKAMKNLGTDEDEIIEIVCRHNNVERQELKKVYMAMYGRDLTEQIKSEISGDFKKGVIGLLTPLAVYESQILRDAMEGAGTDEKMLIELLCTKESHEIEEIILAYRKLYKRELFEDISNEQGGDLGRVFKSLASGGRQQEFEVDFELAELEADELFEAGEGIRIGTDETELIRILCFRSFPQLKETFRIYAEKYESDIEDAIKSETSGDFRRALCVIIKSVKSKPAYFAELLQKSMKGFGTNDEDLIRILVTRSDRDLNEIKEEYQNLYEESLWDDVKSDLSGDYEKLFLTLIGSDE